LTEGWRTTAVAVLAAWTGALALGLPAFALLGRRLGRDRAWQSVRALAPLLDLFGTWAGVLGAAALLLGRRGFGAAWATALGLVALAVTASLYDRAVLMPSLDAAVKRLAAPGTADDRARWEADHAFLARMAAAARLLTLGAVAGALAGAVLA